MKYIISYDLGTGGTKASLIDENGVSSASAFISCDTYYPKAGFREQCPEEWWNSVVVSTKKMLAKFDDNIDNIVALAVSGHSLGAVPIGRDGKLLVENVPIWNDSRAGHEAETFFKDVIKNDWYLTTGNGFPAPLYSIFKMMWYKNNMPSMYEKTDKFIGTKDFINYRMTGVLCTDHSYASGSGVYSLLENSYKEEYISKSGIARDKFPNIFESTHIVGSIIPNVALDLGLSKETLVVCGGVDNSCMALGAACFTEGDAYTSLGTSAWIAVSSNKPIVNLDNHPYVFAHCVTGQYVSATSIFSAGNSFRWVRNTLCKDLVEAEKKGLIDSYVEMDKEAELSPIGANKVIFNPSLAGGSNMDYSPNVRGAFIGLDLMHTRHDLIRATLEGIAISMRIALDGLGKYVLLTPDMLLVGGGGKSKFWRSLFASIYNKNIIETNIGEDAGSMGAAAIAAVGVGIWKDFEVLKSMHKVSDIVKPEKSMVEKYSVLLPLYEKVSKMQADIGDTLTGINL